MSDETAAPPELTTATLPPEATVHQRMSAALAALSYIPKGRSDGVSYAFRGIDALMNHLHPVLAAHGLFLAPRVLEDWRVGMIPGTNNRQQTQAVFRVCVDVYGADGGMVTLGPGLAQSHDYGDKAVYQAQQNAVKYVLLEAFCIPTEEQDQDARQADDVPAPGPQAVDLRPLLDLIADAKAAGLEGDYDRTLAWAAERQLNADKALEKLTNSLAEHQATSAGGDGEAPPAEEQHSEEAAPATSAAPEPEPTAGAQATPPPPSDETWQDHAKRKGVGTASLMVALREVWPKDHAVPARSSAITTQMEDPERAALVHQTIDRLAESADTRSS